MRSLRATPLPPLFSSSETPPRRRFPKENVDPSSPAHHLHAADHTSPSPLRSPSSATKPLGTCNQSLPPRPPLSNPLEVTQAEARCLVCVFPGNGSNQQAVRRKGRKVEPAGNRSRSARDADALRRTNTFFRSLSIGQERADATPTRNPNLTSDAASHFGVNVVSIHEEAAKVKAAGKSWYNTMISDNYYTEFDVFSKWLGVSH